MLTQAFNEDRTKLLNALDNLPGTKAGKELMRLSDEMRNSYADTYHADTSADRWALIAGVALLVLEPFLIMARNGNDMLWYAILGLGIVTGVFLLFSIGFAAVPVVLIGLIIVLLLVRLLMVPLIYLIPVASIGLVGYYLKTQADEKKYWESKHNESTKQAAEAFHVADAEFRKELIAGAGQLCGKYWADRADYWKLIHDLYDQFKKKHAYEIVDSKLRDGQQKEDREYQKLVQEIRTHHGKNPFEMKFGSWDTGEGRTEPLDWWICPAGHNEYVALIKTPQMASYYSDEMNVMLKSGLFNSMLMPWERRLFDENEGFFLLHADDAETLGADVLKCRASESVMKETQVKTELEMMDYSENCWWWLADNGKTYNTKAFVDGEGVIHREGHRMDFDGFAVRIAGIIRI